MAGMVLETNINHILTSVSEQSKLHSNSLRTSTSTTIGGLQSGGSMGSGMGSGGGVTSSALEIGEKIFSTFSSTFSSR